MELPLVALVAVLSSAFVHAAWNVGLARAPRGHDTTAVALTIGLLAWTPLALTRWRVEAAVWPYVLASAAFELAYFAALNAAYARAPAHAVYPVARGLAPTLLLPVAAAGGADVPAIAGVGVLAISAGVLLTGRGGTDRRSVRAAVPVAVCIAGYTYVDALGLRHADPAAYLWLTMVPVVLVLLGLRVAAGRGFGLLTAQVRPAAVGLGLGIYVAYGLTLLALSLVPVALAPAVAALRETSILFVLALSWLAHRSSTVSQDSTVDELGAPARAGPTAATAAGACFILGGVAVLALG
jgi:hypothetical protein